MKAVEVQFVSQSCMMTLLLPVHTYTVININALKCFLLLTKKLILEGENPTILKHKVRCPEAGSWLKELQQFSDLKYKRQFRKEIEGLY